MIESVPLSKLHAGKRNPRRVKPERDAHRRLVASIRTYGLLQPLVVRPNSDEGYEVIAGKRRLTALREIHRENDPEIACHVQPKADDPKADGIALSENFAREGMHPLDEAEAFAKLARADGKDVGAIGSEFGVTSHYVRQRMKLAGLAGPIKTAYRRGQIDTGTAEVFACVPTAKQVEVWRELGEQPRDARHVRTIIDHQWIDAQHARFDVETLSSSAISRDLFSDRVLIERQTFFDAQIQALEQERLGLLDDGWNEVVIAAREDTFDRLHSMDRPQPEPDDETQRQLDAFDREHQVLRTELEGMADEDDADPLYDKLDAMNASKRSWHRLRASTPSQPRHTGLCS